MESQGLHGDGIYYESGERLWVNLYVPSTATWNSTGVQLEMQTSFPEGDAALLKLTLPRPKQLTLALRRPLWAGAGFAVKINGKNVKELSAPGSYIELKRTWKSGDTVALVLPKALHEEATPDNPGRIALMWGPLVLAGDLGPETERRVSWTEPIPSFVAADRPVTEWLQAVPDRPGIFRSTGGRDDDGRAKEIDFVPFYRLHRREYALYWDIYGTDGWRKRLAEKAAEQNRQRRLELATVSFVQPGDTQAEKNFNQQGQDTTPDRMSGRPGRRGKKWFSFELPVDAAHPVILIVTYHSEERSKRTLEILVDGERVGAQTIERSPPGSAAGRFFDVEYKISGDLVRSKGKVTVRFQAAESNEIAAVYGVRMIRGDAER